MEFLLSQEPENKRTNVWDDYVSIIQNENMYDAYLSNEIVEPDAYDKLCHLLDQVDHTAIVRLHLNTPGGMLISAFKLLHSLRNTRATTIAVCTGEVASAGTMIALACQHIEVDDYLMFMCHNYSGGAAGKAHEIEDKLKWDKANLPKFFKQIYHGFLTQSEISTMLKGKDIYLNAQEVLEKWEKRTIARLNRASE